MLQDLLNHCRCLSSRVFTSLFSFDHIKNQELRRRSYMLHVVLLGIALLSFLASICWLLRYFFGTSIVVDTPLPFFTLVSFFLLALLLMWLTKRGKRTLAVSILLLLFATIVLDLFLVWGLLSYQAVAICALLIVIIGVLLSSKMAWVSVSLLSIALLIVFTLRYYEVFPADNHWVNTPQNYADLAILILTYLVIALVSWLSNKETQQALTSSRNAIRYRKQLADKLYKQKQNLTLLVKKKTQALKEHQLKQLLKVNSLAEYGRLSAGILHDIRNPLSVIALKLDTINELLKDLPQKHQQRLGPEILQAKKAYQLITLIISSSRKQLLLQEESQVFELVKLITDTLLLFEHQMQHLKLEYDFHHPQTQVLIKGYPAKLSQVIGNLVMNSLDALEAVPATQRSLTIELSQTTQQIQITISDSGPGIKPDDRQRLFQPLFTTKQNKKGTGLGLYLSQKVLKDYFDGQIKFNKKYHLGAQFIVQLPVKQQSKS
ncbi:MAG: GHKL domain-containing protein [Candidatus Pacebacteria bacterium]|nr:GHKL domain-containing protein [Candidatus Paceibacterota bacterium]